MSDKKYKLPKALYKRLYLIFSTTVGVTLFLFLFITLLNIKVTPGFPSQASFVFTTENVAADTTRIKVVLQPNSNNLKFLRLQLKFEQSKVQLAEEPKVNGTKFGNVASITPTEIANINGVLEIVLVRPEAVLASQPIEVAVLTFDKLTNESSLITIIDEETQLVNSSSKEVTFVPTYTRI